MPNDRDLLAEALPAYDIGEELGRGAWGVVVAGRHRRLRRDVAIKQLPRAFAEDKDVRARFHTEARLLASLDHPHIVPIYEFVEHHGLCALVMERLTGGTVLSLFNDEGLGGAASCALVIAASSGLHYAHGKGVLHRDIKPENMLLSGEQTLKLTDFGIAKVVGKSSAVATKAGYILGTPTYLAPEQATGEPLSPATDVYALGTVLYELLSGELPFPEVSDPVLAVYQKVHEEPRPLASLVRSLPPDFAAVIDRAILREPGDRFPSAEAFGFAVADAAASSWGDDWASETGIIVHGGSGLTRTPRPPEARTRLEKARSPRKTTVAVSQPPTGGRRRRAVAAVLLATLVAGGVAAFALTRHGARTARHGTLTATGAATTLPPDVKATGLAFHAPYDIRCAYASGTLTCTLPNGNGYSVDSSGTAKQLQTTALQPSGDELASGAKWRRESIECGAVPDKGLSCYALANGHGFFMSTFGSNTF
jgi:serine/threonine protein kinase